MYGVRVVMSPPPPPDVMYAAQLAMAELNLQGAQCIAVSRKLAHLRLEAGTPEVMRLTDLGKAMVGERRVAPDNAQGLRQKALRAQTPRSAGAEAGIMSHLGFIN